MFSLSFQCLTCDKRIDGNGTQFCSPDCLDKLIEIWRPVFAKCKCGGELCEQSFLGLYILEECFKCPDGRFSDDPCIGCDCHRQHKPYSPKCLEKEEEKEGLVVDILKGLKGIGKKRIGNREFIQLQRQTKRFDSWLK